MDKADNVKILGGKYAKWINILKQKKGSWQKNKNKFIKWVPLELNE